VTRFFVHNNTFPFLLVASKLSGHMIQAARVTTIWVLSASVPFADEPGAVLVDVHRIWDRAPHSAFTDLVRFRDRWFCVFREGAGHVSPDGALRVIASDDGRQWESAALLTSWDSDLRDAKNTVTPGGQLMLAGAEALHQPAGHKHQSLVWFSDDGRNWSPRREVADPDFWLWRITWHQGHAYGFGYGTRGDNSFIGSTRARREPISARWCQRFGPGATERDVAGVCGGRHILLPAPPWRPAKHGPVGDSLSAVYKLDLEGPGHPNRGTAHDPAA
jgi:hypothetical protein